MRVLDQYELTEVSGGDDGGGQGDVRSNGQFHYTPPNSSNNGAPRSGSTSQFTFTLAPRPAPPPPPPLPPGDNPTGKNSNTRPK